MAGTATDYDVSKIIQTKAQLWAGLAIPGSGARLTLHTDGTPDATANPNAVHLGMTKEGAKIMAKTNFNEFYADEFVDAIKRSIEKQEMSIEAELLQFDIDILALITPGAGTKATGSGYEQIKFGQIDIVYSSVALIWPTEADPTKFGVFHLYKALNTQGFESAIGRKQLSGLPVRFQGQAITTRATTDTTGAWWQQV